jgi:hypothetical protein
MLTLPIAGACVHAGGNGARDRLADAVQMATAAGSFHMRGAFGAGAPLVQWTAVVFGSDELRTTLTGGMLIESRRLDGQLWARRIDQPEPWARIPADDPLDLTKLLAGEIHRVDRDDDSCVITLQYDDVDVLGALTHIPSTGPTSAEVTIVDDQLVGVALDINGHATATVAFEEFEPEP